MNRSLHYFLLKISFRHLNVLKQEYLHLVVLLACGCVNSYLYLDLFFIFNVL